VWIVTKCRKCCKSNSHCALWTELLYIVLWHFFSLDKFHNKNKILELWQCFMYIPTTGIHCCDTDFFFLFSAKKFCGQKITFIIIFLLDIMSDNLFWLHAISLPLFPNFSSRWIICNVFLYSHPHPLLLHAIFC